MTAGGTRPPDYRRGGKGMYDGSDVGVEHVTFAALSGTSLITQVDGASRISLYANLGGLASDPYQGIIPQAPNGASVRLKHVIAFDTNLTEASASAVYNEWVTYKATLQ